MPAPRTPAFGVSRPSHPGLAPRQPSAPFGVPAAAFPTSAAAGRPPQRETARVQPLRPRSRWRSALFFLLVILGGGAAAVHHWVVPIDVLLVWRNPAALTVATDPDGASLRLDGADLAGTSPTTVTVRRDLVEHVIEVSRPGYRPARAVVRYDKTVALSFLLPLQKDPTAVPPPAAPNPSGVEPAKPAKPSDPAR
jgi:hypothetical protein